MYLLMQAQINCTELVEDMKTHLITSLRQAQSLLRLKRKRARQAATWGNLGLALNYNHTNEVQQHKCFRLSYLVIALFTLFIRFGPTPDQEESPLNFPTSLPSNVYGCCKATSCNVHMFYLWCIQYVWVGLDAAVQYQKLYCAAGIVSRDAKQDETFRQETAGDPYL